MAQQAMHDFSPPRGALIGAAVLMALTFVAAVVGRTTDIGAERMPASPVVESRLLVISNSNAAAGSARVTDAADGSLVRQTKAGPEEGFIWGAVNGLSYGRKQIGGDLLAPYELARRADGRLTLTDTVTGQKVFLDAFGSSNAAAWARVLDAKPEAKEATR